MALAVYPDMNRTRRSGVISIVCAPIYSRGEGLSTQVPVGIEEGLKHDSWIICDNLGSVQKAQLTDYVGSLSRSITSQLNRAMKSALDLL